ncbi:hypothetical protein ACLB2K_003934 [Fragaria x ananassa]
MTKRAEQTGQENGKEQQQKSTNCSSSRRLVLILEGTAVNVRIKDRVTSKKPDFLLSMDGITYPQKTLNVSVSTPPVSPPEPAGKYLNRPPEFSRPPQPPTTGSPPSLVPIYLIFGQKLPLPVMTEPSRPEFEILDNRELTARWESIRLMDFAKVEDYNQAMLNFQAELSYCGVDKTDKDMIEKTLYTFPTSMSLLSHQYRLEYEQNRVTSFSDLICVLAKKEWH